jgi:hypothetical protein
VELPPLGPLRPGHEVACFHPGQGSLGSEPFSSADFGETA